MGNPLLMLREHPPGPEKKGEGDGRRGIGGGIGAEGGGWWDGWFRIWDNR